jgi:multidrug efflux system membrane fusion protein
MASTDAASDPASPQSPRRGASLRLALAGVIVLLAVVAGLWFWLRNAADAPAAQGRGGFDAGAHAFPVVAAPATQGAIDIYLDALGTVTPRNMVTVRSRVDGQLLRVAFREGQFVKAGELLAEVDPRPFEVQLKQAQGQMAKDQALLKNAQLDLERYRTLLAQDSIAKQQVDTQEALVRQYEGTVLSDQGQIDSAKLQLTYSRITAPISGIVGLRQIDPGNVVHASDANGLVVITQLQPITVLFPIPEDNLPQVLTRLKSGAALRVDAYDRAQQVKLATGRLLTADNQIDTSTGTVKLRAEFANEDNALFPNQFVNVRLLVDTRQGATLLPTAAVQRGAPGTFVYAVNEDHTVSVKPVKLGPAQGEVTSVDSGIAPGALVVVDGADKLREGAKVELITREARAAPAPDTSRHGGKGGKGGERTPGDGARRARNGG